MKGINKTYKKSGDGKVRLRYRVYVYSDQKVRHVGYFKTEEEAYKAWYKAQELVDLGVYEYQDSSENGELRLI